jgi:conserved oligomeric Golgi complex subunit 8
MDSEDKILKLINYESSPESKAEAVNYLHKLRTYKKENLKKDSVTIKDDLNNLDLQTQEIAFSNYPAFIKTAESSRQVLKGWNDTTKNVENLIDKLPNFAQECDKFVKTTLEIQTASRLNSLTMKRHVELLEILELPQLMESSIREEKYEDALELAAYVQKLGSKFDNVPVVNVSFFINLVVYIFCLILCFALIGKHFRSQFYL